MKDWINQRKIRKLFLQAAKIAVGSSLGMCIAEKMNLQFATSVGTITLLTLVMTKWDTVRLSVYRILSFGISVLLAGVLFQTIRSEWVAYGAYIFLVFLICTFLDWKAVISVNAVIGTHFLVERDFSYAFIRNEFLLVLTGITIALVLNLFHGNRSHQDHIIKNMRQTEQDLQMILGELAAYLDDQRMQRDVWADLRLLEEQLHHRIAESYEYQDNTFSAHPEYYINYFEMRMGQCQVLHSLHSEMRKIRKIPKQAKIVSQYIVYLIAYVTEINVPTEQMKALDEIFKHMENEPLPTSREEFENRALLYHVLMDLEEFLILKKRFVESLDEKQRAIYWNKKIKKGVDNCRTR